jgi:hypothetical protein
MKLTTNDRELICVLIALNGIKPEASHSARKRKMRAFEQLGLERLEDLAQPGKERAQMLPAQYPTEPSELDIESGTVDYLLEKFGADGEVAGGALVERAVCRFVDKLRSSEQQVLSL